MIILLSDVSHFTLASQGYCSLERAPHVTVMAILKSVTQWLVFVWIVALTLREATARDVKMDIMEMPVSRFASVRIHSEGHDVWNVTSTVM